MNKKIYVLLSLCAVCALFIGCNAKVDKNGFYHDFDDAKKAAVSEGKNILLFVSSFEDDNGASSLLQNNVFATQEAKNSIAKKYACVNLNFSNAEYESASIDPATASNKAKKQAEKIVAQYQKKIAIVSNLAIQGTPSVFLFSPEGYLICDVPVAEISDYAGFMAALESKAELEITMKNLIAATVTGSNLERASGIDVLYEATAPESRGLLKELILQFNELDKNNELQLGGKYVLAVANIQALEASVEQRYMDAVQIFATAAESPLISGIQKQQAYYMAGYTMAQLGMNDLDAIASYFQKSYEAAPDSEYAPQIQQMIMMAYAMKQTPAPEEGVATEGNE
ncbi:MAG: hypothetical protein K6E51_03845 [Treponema sp.]|nr:hypothetical protein [Treponema sp.]